MKQSNESKIIKIFDQIEALLAEAQAAGAGDERIRLALSHYSNRYKQKHKLIK